jgi:hypothetical protein
MVNIALISGAVGYPNVNERGKTRLFCVTYRFFARFGRLTKKANPDDPATEVILVGAIHSLLLTNGSFCRGALTDGA